MKFAICNETFQDMPFPEAFAMAASAGYTGIEIAPFTIHKDAFQISRQQRDAVRRDASEAGLEVVGLHWLLAFTEGLYWTSPEAAVRDKTAEYIRELARLCRDLGGRVLVLGSPMQRNLLPGVSHEQAMEYAAEVLKAAMPEIESCGVVMAVEPLGPAEGDFLNTAALGERLIEMVGSPSCRLHLDVKAMSTEAMPIAEVIRRHATHLEHFHANDPNKLGPGMGEVAFEPIFEALRDVGYDRWVSVEVFDYSPGPEAIARRSIEYMRACLERISG